MRVRLHALEPATRANGPGLRAGVWFQGCTLGCAGCFNRSAHDPAGGLETDTATVAEQLLANPHGIEGVSFSGGEPFQQPEALLDLLKRLLHSPLSKLAFSGYTLPELQQLPLGPEALRRLDVLVAGRYVQALHVGAGLLGSSNQQIHLLTGRYRVEDFSRIPAAEVILHADGRVTLSGMAAVRLDLGGGNKLKLELRTGC